MGYSTDHAPTEPQASQVVSLVINQVTYDSMIGQVSIPFNPQFGFLQPPIVSTTLW